MGGEVSGGRRSMGREHRLSRDPRLREKGGRRPARVSPAVSARSASGSASGAVRFAPGTAVTLAGIDVGEDYLDLAFIRAGDDALTLHRVPLAGIEGEGDAVGALMRRL